MEIKISSFSLPLSLGIVNIDSLVGGASTALTVEMDVEKMY